MSNISTIWWSDKDKYDLLLKNAGDQIGVGCYGRILKGQAVGIKGSVEPVTTVAVKMIKSRSLAASRELECLVAELKILIYLGPHVNVVGLLGACTKNITRGIQKPYKTQ